MTPWLHTIADQNLAEICCRFKLHPSYLIGKRKAISSHFQNRLGAAQQGPHFPLHLDEPVNQSTKDACKSIGLHTEPCSH